MAPRSSSFPRCRVKMLSIPQVLQISSLRWSPLVPNTKDSIWRETWGSSHGFQEFTILNIPQVLQMSSLWPDDTSVLYQVRRVVQLSSECLLVQYFKAVWLKRTNIWISKISDWLGRGVGGVIGRLILKLEKLPQSLSLTLWKQVLIKSYEVNIAPCDYTVSKLDHFSCRFSSVKALLNTFISKGS